MPALVIERGHGAGTEFQFDKSLMMGRSRGPETELSLDHGSVSRRHARVVKVDGDYMAVDLGSANGTRVNGQRITRPTPLHDGDRLQIGVFILRFVTGTAHTSLTTSPVKVRDEDGGGVERHVVLRVSAESDDLAADGEQRGLAAAMAKRLQFLTKLGSALSEHFDQPALLDFVLVQLLELMPQADRSFILLPDAVTGVMTPYAARTRRGPESDVGVSRTLVAEAVRRREVIVVLDTQVDGEFAAAESIRLLGLRAIMCAPLIYNGEVCGVLQVDSTHASAPFGRSEASLLVGIASQVALVLALSQMHARALERELLEHDLALARRIQQQFLPDRLPSVPGYSIGVHYEPALAVGGDFYDVFELSGGRIAIVLGDVAGKGISAALLMARLGSELRYHSVGQSEPRPILQRVNASLERSASEGMFATTCMLVLEPATGALRISNAGHPPPLVRNPDGTTAPLGAAGGAPLGLVESADIRQESLQLAPGAAVVLFSDGITEAVSQTAQLFGTERLARVLAGSSGDAERLRTAVVDAVRAFRGSAAQSDDLTLVSIARSTIPTPAVRG
jgi:sigma-B regulation protein RsbU (phosphoserine phosphatase)